MNEINKIDCLALNYKGVGIVNHPPLYFLKSRSCITLNGGIVPYPTFEVEQVWTEAELVIVVGKDETIKGYSVAGDITCSNVCGRDHHLPMSKARTGFCPIGSFRPVSDVDTSKPLIISTFINGIMTQKGSTEDMIFSIDQCIDYVSKIVRLEENDIILTGTPLTPGGGPQYDCIVRPGDKIKHVVDGVGEVNYEFR